MIEIENVEVYGFESAIRGMRNPMNSWDKSDSKFDCDEIYENCCDGCRYYDNKSILICKLAQTGERFVFIGPNDLKLMQKLAKAGNDHGKFARMINVAMDIIAPLYWWKEFDTYKVGTVSNSCSTMHKIHSKEFTLDDFSFDNFGDLDDVKQYIDDYGKYMTFAETVIENCEELRKSFLKTGDKRHWRYLIQLLPSSYNQKRTVQLNYQVLWAIYKARKDHKLDEWRDFCALIESLPYFKEIFIVSSY